MIAEHRPEGRGPFATVVLTESWADPEVWAAVGALWLLVTFDPFTADPPPSGVRSVACRHRLGGG